MFLTIIGWETLFGTLT